MNPPGNDQADPVASIQVNEEMKSNLADNMEGPMEAIGLRGLVLSPSGTWVFLSFCYPQTLTADLITNSRPSQWP